MVPDVISFTYKNSKGESRDHDKLKLNGIDPNMLIFSVTGYRGDRLFYCLERITYLIDSETNESYQHVIEKLIGGWKEVYGEDITEVYKLRDGLSLLRS